MKVWTMVFIFLFGFALAYYMPNTAQMTLGKLYPRG